jgi:hypothetical protein
MGLNARELQYFESEEPEISISLERRNLGELEKAQDKEGKEENDQDYEEYGEEYD